MDDSGDTALHFACIHGHFAAAVALVGHGASLRLRNNAGQTARAVASTPLLRTFLDTSAVGYESEGFEDMSDSDG